MSEVVSALKDFLLAAQTLGPWGVVFFLWWQGQKDRKQFEETSRVESKRWEEWNKEAVRRYEDNVLLVKQTQTIAMSLQDIVIFNTQTMTQVKDMADSNLFCPIVRRETKQREVNR